MVDRDENDENNPPKSFPGNLWRETILSSSIIAIQW